MDFEAETFIHQLRTVIDKMKKEQEYFVARNERLEDENKYLKNQVDVLLKVIGKENHGN